MNYTFFLVLAALLLTTKVFSIIMKRIGLPQVLGALLAGVLLGATGLIKSSMELTVFATIGVNLIMFSAGLETDFGEIRKNGVASVVITVLGVAIPMILGFAVSWILPDISMKERWFLGVILTATSVGITVATLKELGVLHGKVGSSIVTAAILDDIIGIVILAFFSASTKPTTLGARFVSACGGNISSLATLVVLLNVVLFFVIGIAFGILLHHGFKWLSKKFPHTRRLSIYSLIACFLYAWGAEELFGVAAITGSFLAGMMLAKMKQTEYVGRRIDTSGYLMFAPVFFANIGISMPYQSIADNFSWLIVAFSLLFVFAGIAAKLIGCGAGALLCKYTPSQSFKVGIGMIVRGEVCLIVAQAGLSAGLIQEQLFPAIILLIICSSVTAPIILKSIFKKYPNELPDARLDGDAAAETEDMALTAIFAKKAESMDRIENFEYDENVTPTTLDELVQMTAGDSCQNTDDGDAQTADDGGEQGQEPTQEK